MLLKKNYGPDGSVSHVEVKHTGTSPEQNFSHRLVEAGMADGWVTVEDDALTMKTDAEPLRYQLKRKPGYYCVSTGDRIPISDIAWTQACTRAEAILAPREARKWLAARGLAETDYEVTRAYECVLGADQHDTFKKGA